MPIYEYHCGKCETTIERIQQFSDPILTTCDVCGGSLKKLMGKPALQFKGTGFYITDYARKGMTDPSSSESPGSTASSGESEKKTSSESSPAPAAPAATASEKSGSETKSA